ncbi:hypothetical protein GGX14DRAFT_387902 [Mycena pura]|uniref:Uncharacterized protein n=1 Tax=Mycena pura TaxID=153505 RepID=A0AAD6YMK8_9AGAR|nr:hypothetical protein GGX14DRAFT_387902 [Mycena pura]
MPNTKKATSSSPEGLKKSEQSSSSSHPVQQCESKQPGCEGGSVRWMRMRDSRWKDEVNAADSAPLEPRLRNEDGQRRGHGPSMKKDSPRTPHPMGIDIGISGQRAWAQKECGGDRERRRHGTGVHDTTMRQRGNGKWVDVGSQEGRKKGAGRAIRGPSKLGRGNEHTLITKWSGGHRERLGRRRRRVDDKRTTQHPPKNSGEAAKAAGKMGVGRGYHRTLMACQMWGTRALFLPEDLRPAAKICPKNFNGIKKMAKKFQLLLATTQINLHQGVFGAHFLLRFLEAISKNRVNGGQAEANSAHPPDTAVLETIFGLRLSLTVMCIFKVKQRSIQIEHQRFTQTQYGCIRGGLLHIPDVDGARLHLLIQAIWNKRAWAGIRLYSRRAATHPRRRRCPVTFTDTGYLEQTGLGRTFVTSAKFRESRKIMPI